MIADRLLSTVGTTDLSALIQDLILNFPSNVNRKRDEKKLYDIDEAYQILKSCNSISSYEFVYEISSTNVRKVHEAAEEFNRQLIYLLESSGDRTVCAIYTSPPYTVLFYKSKGDVLKIVDTHGIPDKFGGNQNAGIITAKISELCVRSLTSWLLIRIGDKNSFIHEPAVIIPPTANSFSGLYWLKNGVKKMKITG